MILILMSLGASARTSFSSRCPKPYSSSNKQRMCEKHAMERFGSANPAPWPTCEAKQQPPKGGNQTPRVQTLAPQPPRSARGSTKAVLHRSVVHALPRSALSRRREQCPGTARAGGRGQTSGWSMSAPCAHLWQAGRRHLGNPARKAKQEQSR